MDEKKDRVIVLKSFQRAIDASLAKSKLDAYGVPCFLSDEHISGLYPFYPNLAGGVRLHVFESDQEQALSILTENATLPDEDELAE